MGKEVSVVDNNNGEFVDANNMSPERETTLLDGIPNDMSQSVADCAVYENATTDAPGEPYEGMMFKTAEDAVQFDNLYAYQTGFSIRKASHYMSKKKDHVREVYTRTMYRLFKEQLKATSSYDLEETETNGTYRLTKLEDHKKPNTPRASYIVIANASAATASCNCKLFQFNGLLCSHVLKILIHLKIHHIPSHYILKRWTKNAKDLQSNVIVEKKLNMDNSSSKAMRFNSLCKYMLKIASESSTSLESYEFACEKLDNLLEEIISLKKNI